MKPVAAVGQGIPIRGYTAKLGKIVSTSTGGENSMAQALLSLWSPFQVEWRVAEETRDLPQPYESNDEQALAGVLEGKKV